MTTVLPKKLSALLRLAVEDAQRIEKTPGYKLNMSVFHVGGFRTDPLCHVCLAGSVMACRLGAAPQATYIPRDFAENVYQLKAIDCMRKGHFERAAELLDMKPTSEQLEVMHLASEAVGYFNVSNTLEGRSEWASYIEAADILERAGL